MRGNLTVPSHRRVGKADPALRPGKRACSPSQKDGVVINLTGPIALLFPGQGVQKPGMGRNLYDRYPAARRVFERAEEVLEMPVRRLCFEGPQVDLNRTDVIQPCVMTVCWAAYEVWRESYGFENVSVTAGHSLGEIASLAEAVAGRDAHVLEAVALAPH